MKRFLVIITLIAVISGTDAIFAQSAAEEAHPQAAPSVLPLTLNDVLKMMLENNLNVAVDRISPDVARSLIGTYSRPFQPNLHISAAGSRGTMPSVTFLNGAPFLFQLTHSYDVGFDQTLRTGTTYGVDLSLNRVSSNSIFLLYNPSWFNTARYSLTQHLLQNRAVGVNSHSIRIAQNNHKISESQFEQQMLDLVEHAQNTYWDYVSSIEDMKVKRQSVELAEKILAENQQKAAAGVIAPLDVVQAESQVASMQDALVVSTYSSRQSEDQLKRTISSETDPGQAVASLVPVDPLHRPAPEDLMTVEQAIRVALENRPEIRQARLAIESADINRTYTKNQTLPVLDITAGFTQTGLSGIPVLASPLSTLIPGATITGLKPGTMSDSLQQTFSSDYKTYSFGFNLQIPISNKAARSDYEAAISTRKTAQAQMNAISQQIALEVRTALNQVQMNRAHIESAGKARELAEKTLDAEQKKYESGVSTLFFVLQDQTNLAVAQTNEVQALVNYTKSLVALDHATGQTLSHNRIEIQNAAPRIAANPDR